VTIRITLAIRRRAKASFNQIPLLHRRQSPRGAGAVQGHEVPWRLGGSTGFTRQGARDTSATWR
jgi:hypothetical protein